MKPIIALAALLLGTIGCSIRIPLENPPEPRSDFPGVIRFVASPEIIHSGEKSVLQWDARNVPEVWLEKAQDPHAETPAEFNSLGKFPASGTLEVQPKASTTFVVSCGDDKIGCASASVHVTVK